MNTENKKYVTNIIGEIQFDVKMSNGATLNVWSDNQSNAIIKAYDNCLPFFNSVILDVYPSPHGILN